MVSTIDPSWSNTLMLLQKGTCYLLTIHEYAHDKLDEEVQMCV